MKIHLICRQGLNHKHIGNHVFETGNWARITDNTADEAVGGRIYLHEKQRDFAWHGGIVIGWRESANEPGRKVLIYRVDGPFRIKCKKGWARQMAIERDGCLQQKRKAA